MAKALDKPPGRMTVDQFVDWAMAQPDGRYELMDGEVVAMAPERAAHARLKAKIWRALENAIAERGVACEALPDGMTVRIDAHTAYEPDAQVHCGERLSDETVIVPSPLIVVEVLSPRTSSRDVGAKLADYFRVAEHPPLSDREDRPADCDPPSPRRGRRHRDPDRHCRRAATRSRRASPSTSTASTAEARCRRACAGRAPRAILGGRRPHGQDARQALALRHGLRRLAGGAGGASARRAPVLPWMRRTSPRSWKA